MKVSLDIKKANGDIYTRNIVVNDDRHLSNYLRKAARDESESKIIGVHKEDDSDKDLPEVWMGTVDCGKYSIEVVGKSEQEVWKSLQEEFDKNWRDQRDLKEQMEYSGGFVQKLTFGKIYFDGFRE